MSFDLEKARATYSAGCAEDAANLVPDLIAGIERLRADNACLSKAVISIQEERDLAQAEFRAYHKAWEEQAIEIERLRAELASANVELLAAGELVTQLKRVREAEIDQAGAAERMYLDGVRAKDVRIKELEDALVDERASRVYYEDSCPFRLWNDIKLKDKFLEKAKWQLQRGGKIRPNAKQHDHTAEFFRPNESPAKSWQVTDGRVRAICWAEEMAGDCKAGDVLRAMLKEAERE